VGSQSHWHLGTYIRAAAAAAARHWHLGTRRNVSHSYSTVFGRSFVE